jgi:hypothetical protein
MDKKKSIDLIKLEVLGCLTDKDKENLQKFKDEGGEFPWKEQGDYQNLIAMLPLSLELKHPANELKDKTAMKLYSIRDQIKAKIDSKKASEMPTEPIEVIEDAVQEFEFNEETVANLASEQIEIEEKEFAEVEESYSVDAEAALGKKEPTRFPSKYKEKSKTESLFRQPEETETKEIVKPTIDKEAIEKITREYIKSHTEKEIISLKKSMNKNKILSFILFVIAVILIVVSYFFK